MKSAIHHNIIFRTPRFPLNAQLEDCWQELKQAISESSEAFYEVIKELEAEDIGEQPANIRNTIWKYFNRAKHRSTPFGSFAAVGICKGGFPTDSQPITVQSDLIYHRFSDWSLKDEMEYTFEDLLKTDCLLFTNSTCYPVGESIRYISFRDGKFEIAEVEADDFLRCVLELFRTPVSILSVIDQLAAMFPETDAVQEHLESLIALQLLYTSLDANITGTDYFVRSGLPQAPIGKKQYIISERKTTAGQFDLRLLGSLDKLVDTLRQSIPITENPMLGDFVRRFGKRFEGREVPLMVALDPELGMGYGDMESLFGLDETIALLAAKKADNAESPDPIKDALAGRLFGDIRQTSSCIRLEELNTKVAGTALMPLPNTFNCLFTVVDGIVWMEQTGGATATSLAGRFTLAVDEIHRFTKELAALESQANPDVVFFDLAYMAETHVDNVNRRKHSYDYQLALLNYDTSRKPLTADDILISVQGNQPVLRSKRLGKRLVPRLASAYNHIRSDLPVFRLLCDIQQVGIQTNLSFRPEQLFPELRHYPRVQYRNIVISPEKWKINRKELRTWLLENDGKSNFSTYLLEMGVCRYFRCGVADQTLYFDRDNAADMEAFGHYADRMENLLLEEVPRPDNSTVTDKQGNPYAVQYLATLTHKERVYPPLENAAAITLANSEVTRSFLPGREWLYLEIHCHPGRMDTLLCKAVNHLSKDYDNLIRQWFFIHYDEGDSPHIRLRFLLYHPSDSQLLTAALSALFEADIQIGLVSDIRVRTYHRELERYGSDLIELVEKHFCRDSVCVMRLLENGVSEHDRYRLSIELAKLVMLKSLPGMDNLEQWSDRVLHSLQKEHRLTAKEFALLNKRYTGFSGTLSDLSSGILDELVTSLLNVLEQCPKERRNRLFSDLFHMHVNRLFSTDQRTHEMVIYYFLIRSLKAEAHRAKGSH